MAPNPGPVSPPIPTPFSAEDDGIQSDTTPKSTPRDIVADRMAKQLALSTSPTSKLIVKVPSVARVTGWDDEQPSTATRSGRYHRSQPFFIGVAGGTASGKTTVCDCIMQRLHDQCVVMLSQDSFYRGLTEEELSHVQGGIMDGRGEGVDGGGFVVGDCCCCVACWGVVGGVTRHTPALLHMHTVTHAYCYTRRLQF